MSENKVRSKKEAAFALAALMEIPIQYRATQQLEFNDKKVSGGPHSRPLPPPREVIDHDNSVKQVAHTRSSSSAESTAVDSNVPVEQACPICLEKPRNMAFGCGHLTCQDCGEILSTCPLCRKDIKTRLRLYG